MLEIGVESSGKKGDCKRDKEEVDVDVETQLLIAELTCVGDVGKTGSAEPLSTHRVAGFGEIEGSASSDDVEVDEDDGGSGSLHFSVVMLDRISILA